MPGWKRFTSTLLLSIIPTLCLAADAPPKSDEPAERPAETCPIIGHWGSAGCPPDDDGADLYSEFGDANHPLRSSREYTAEQWKTIMMHMRVIGPLPAERTRRIAEFLGGE